MRENLKKARELADLSQQELADLVGVKQPIISRWESGKEDPQPFQRRLIRGILGITKDADPHLFDNIQGSVGFREFIEMLRRQFIEYMAAKFGGMAVLGNVSLAIVSSPTVEPEEYLACAGITIAASWEWLHQGNLGKVQKAINDNIGALKRLATTISPYQSMAANLTVQSLIMQVIIDNSNNDIMARERHCIQAVNYAALTGDRRLLAVTMDWQADIYTMSYPQPQRAIDILNNALKELGNESAPVVRSAIYSNLSIAYGRDNTQAKHEKMAMDYADMAICTMPTDPELDAMYQYIHFDQPTLAHCLGKAYLHLAEYYPNDGYGKLAYDLLARATSKPTTTETERSSQLISKADAARAINDMSNCVESLTDGLAIAYKHSSLRRLTQAHEVLTRVPAEWKKESAIQQLQKDVSHALIVARS